MTTPAALRTLHYQQRTEAKVRQHCAKSSVAKGTTMSKFNTLVARGVQDKREVNIHEVACYLLLHYKQKQHATLFSAFHSLHLNQEEFILDWQQWLKKQILDHPAWCTRSDRQETELNPKLHIRVGAYVRKGIPSIELLQHSGKIADFLRITESSTISPLSTGKGKQRSVIPMVAITAYIRNKDDDSFEDELLLSSRSIASKSYTELLPAS